MKTCLVAIGLLMLVPAPTLAEDPEASIKESLKFFRDLTDVLKSVKDKASAEAASAKLKALDERSSALKKKEAEFAKLSPEEQKRVLTKYKADFEMAMKAFATEFERIEKLPEVKAQLIKESVMVKQAYEKAAEVQKYLEEAKVDVAKIGIRRIQSAVFAYKLRQGEFPPTLAVLTEGKQPALEKKDLSDPWNKPYQYDPAKLNKAGKPHIWTVGPDKKVIDNWDEEKK